MTGRVHGAKDGLRLAVAMSRGGAQVEFGAGAVLGQTVAIEVSFPGELEVRIGRSWRRRRWSGRLRRLCLWLSLRWLLGNRRRRSFRLFGWLSSVAFRRGSGAGVAGSVRAALGIGRRS